VFNLYDSHRLAEWKKFRDFLEESEEPLQEIVNFWNKAPFVSNYLNPTSPEHWPDPWNLVLNSDLDSLAISLGMLYTIKLTQRFNDSKCEIHTLTLEDTGEESYFLVVDNQHVLNFNYGEVNGTDVISGIETSMIWSMQDRL